MFSTSVFSQSPGSGVTIENLTYPTVIIGQQEWMVTNLHATQNINYVNDMFIWASTTLPSYCDYLDDPTNAGFGRGHLYNWYAVEYINQIAPAGWHVPSKEEWEQLISITGNLDNLKDDSNLSWLCTSNNDMYNFSAIATGWRYVQSNLDNPAYYDYQMQGSFFWTSTSNPNANETNKAYRAAMLCSSPKLNVNATREKQFGMSIRLVKNLALSTEKNEQVTATVYPNPVKDKFSISVAEDVLEVQIYNVTDKLVKQLYNVKGNIDVSELENGLYMLRIITSEHLYSSKFIKQ